MRKLGIQHDPVAQVVEDEEALIGLDGEHGVVERRVLRWLPAYLRWYAYAFATTWLRRPARSVRLNPTRGEAT